MELPVTYGTSPALILKQTQTIPNDNNASTLPNAIVENTASLTNSASSAVEVHPLVLLSILDHHARRQEGSGRVIGTLLGKKKTGTAAVEITNCFAVPHAERGDEVAIGKDFNRQMLALHLRANRKEVVVGWYATALPVEEEDDVDVNGEKSNGKLSYKCIADTSSLIHEFYAGECDDDPVHLVVDTSLTNDTIALKAYKSTPVQVKGEPLANLFHEIRLAIKPTESERICVDHMIRHSNNNTTTDEDGDADETNTTPSLSLSPMEDDGTTSLQLSMERLYEMLETASAYVDGVVEGKLPSDDGVGRKIADTLVSVPRIRPEVFDRMFNDSLQDLLMVTYLSNITRTQLTIAEKLDRKSVV